MSFSTLSYTHKAAFVAGQCAARRDRWIHAARTAKRDGAPELVKRAVKFARQNSADLVDMLRRVNA